MSGTEQKYWVVEQSGLFWCGEMTTDKGATQMLHVIYERNRGTLSDGSTPVFTLRQVSKSEFDQLKLDQVWFDYLCADVKGQPS